MQKPNLVACLVILLTFSAPAFASGAPGSTGAPGGGAPGASASSSGATAASPSAGSGNGGSGTMAQSGNQQGVPPSGGGIREGGPGPMTPEKLAEVKAMLGKRLDTIIADLQQRSACIKAAATSDALRVCIPHGPGGPGRMNDGGKPQGQQPQKPQ